MDFVSLHHHSTFSKGDGHGPPRKHVQRAHELGMTVIGGTEHGNLSSGVQYEQACDDFGMKFVPGVEAYGSPAIREEKYKRKTHQTILAITDEGYQNLNKIVTQSYRDFYQFPTVTWDSLKGHSDGLVVTSGCASSLVSCKLLGGKFFGPERKAYTDKQFESALRVVRAYKKVFGDRYYLEVQRFPELDRISTINQALEQISALEGIPLLATADVHYCFEHEAYIQQALHAGHRGSTVVATGESWEYDIPLTHPESDEEIIDDLIASGLSEKSARQAVQNTAIIGERAKVRLPKSTPLKFPLPPEISATLTSAEYLDEQIAAGIEYRAAYGKHCDGPDYQERIAHELSVMKLKPEFVDYFLFLSDLICWAKDQGIFVGPGRGSAAASLVCYLLRITEIDPMTVPSMVFERFMDASRTDPPDIDIDISDTDRWKLVEYLKDKYGFDNVGNVANIVHYKGVSALKKVGIIYRIPQSVLKPLKDRIENRAEDDARKYNTIEDAIDRYGEDPEIKEILDAHPEAIQVAKAIEGDIETFGSHAAGYVVSDKPIPNYVALYSRETADGFDPSLPRSIPYDKRDAEYLGMMKADLLGLATCGMIDKSLQSIRQLARDSGSSSLLTLHEIYAMEYDDPEILQGFREDDLVGIFQFEGGTTRGICKRVQPQSVLDLSDINALSRPGPLFSGAVDRYIASKNGDLQPVSYHELYDQHVENTYGQLVYQEQIMFVLRDLAGFDTAKVLYVRKIIGKKLGEHKFAELWEDFKTGCAKTVGLDADTAWEIWSSITTAAGYAFNIAHSYSYSVIAYWTMYFKKYHPESFYASSLANNGDGKDDIPRRTRLLQDTKLFGRDIEIMPLSAALSKSNWSVQLNNGKRCLTPGFVQVPGIGEATGPLLEATQADYVRTESDKKAFSFETLTKLTKGTGPAALKGMKALAEASDPFGIHRTEKQLGAFRDQLAAGDFDGILPDLEEFFTTEEMDTSVEPWERVAWVGLVANIAYRDAVEYERTKTGKPVEQILEEMEDSHLVKHAVVFAYDETAEVAVRFGRKIFPRWKSALSQLQADHHIIVVIGKKMPGMGNSIIPDNMWVLDPDEEETT